MHSCCHIFTLEEFLFPTSGIGTGTCLSVCVEKVVCVCMCAHTLWKQLEKLPASRAWLVENRFEPDKQPARIRAATFLLVLMIALAPGLIGKGWGEILW